MSFQRDPTRAKSYKIFHWYLALTLSYVIFFTIFLNWPSNFFPNGVSGKIGDRSMIPLKHLISLYPVFWILTIILVQKATHFMPFTRFKKIYDPDSQLPLENYIKLGYFVMILSHHEDEFKVHEMQIGSKRICTGCLGTIIGVSTGLIIHTFFIFYCDISTISNHSRIFLNVLGILLILISLVKYLRPVTGFLRLFLNTIFIFGFWPTLWAVVGLPFSLIFLTLYTTISLITRLALGKISHTF